MDSKRKFWQYIALATITPTTPTTPITPTRITSTAPKTIKQLKKEFYSSQTSSPRNTAPRSIASIYQQKLGKKMDNKLVSEWLNAQNATAQAHEEFLRLNNAFSQAQIALLTQQLMLSQNLTPEQLQQLQQNQTVTINYQNAPQSNLANKPVPSQKMPKPYNGPVFLDWKGSMEFAVGKIGKALGDFFAPIDNHPTRVRLPDIPLNFVDRIITVEGEKGSLGKGRVVTEHDVYPNPTYPGDNFAEHACYYCTINKANYQKIGKAVLNWLMFILV